jgi:hypothetical protein
MGIKQIETQLFIDFLIEKGFIYERHKSSHYTFDNPPGKPQLDRPLIVRIKHKEIPILHIHTNLTTASISHKEFADWLSTPKKKLKAEKQKIKEVEKKK